VRPLAALGMMPDLEIGRTRFPALRIGNVIMD